MRRSDHIAIILFAAAGLTSGGRAVAQCPGVIPGFAWYNDGNTVYFEDRTETFGYGNYNIMWNFGDGSNDSGSIVSHGYTTADIDTVQLSFDVLGCSYQISGVVGHGGPSDFCPAPFSTTFSGSPYMNNGMSFSDLTTGATDLLHFWSFGDGTIDIAQSPSHFFVLPGAYDVTHSAAALSNACVAGSVSRVLVDGNVSTCDSSLFLELAVSGFDGYATFNAQAIAMDTSLIIASFIWDYGDGEGEATIAADAYHEYVYSGVFQTCLRVTAYDEIAQDSCFALACASLTAAAVGVEEQQAASSLTASPVPCSEEVTIAGEAISPGAGWWIHDAVGREMERGILASTGPVRMDLRTLPAGIYVLRVGTGKAARVVFVKQ